MSEIEHDTFLVVKTRLGEFGGNMQRTPAHTPSHMITKLLIDFIKNL